MALCCLAFFLIKKEKYMDTNTTTNINEIENNDKISVADYLNNKELIKLTYLPFDTKMRIVSGVIMEVKRTKYGYGGQ